MTKGTLVTIGVFDGVHLGHQKIIKSVARAARSQRLKSVVITFDPHPRRILCKKAPPLLLSLKHRLSLIKSLGVDRCVVVNFTKSFARITAKGFIEKILVKRFGAAGVFVGEDFVFGSGAKADISALKKYSREFKLRITVVKTLKANRRPISSSLIRRYIKEGRLNAAERLLGRPVSVLGTVVRGDARGRILGFPTANVNPHHEVVPPAGVYAVRISAGGRSRKGIVNIGTRPTFYPVRKAGFSNGAGGPRRRDMEPLIEAHIFGFSKKIYGKDIEISFLKKLRGEKKFAHRNALIRQIKADAKKARTIL